MKHKMRLNDEPFYKIKDGTKTIEMRLFDEKRQRINIGDEIEFSRQENESEKIKTKVIALHRFNSFKDLYENLDIIKCGYSESEKEKASYTDMEEYYPKEKQEQYGVVGIEIERI